MALGLLAAIILANNALGAIKRMIYTADSGGHIVVEGLVPGHEYEVKWVDVTPITPPPPPPPASGRYALNSPWNTLIPANATTRPNTTEMVAFLLGQDSEHRLHAAVTNGAYSRGEWKAKSTDPLVTVKLTQNWGANPLNGAKIHVPANAKPAPGTDGHFALIDADGVKEYDFWQMKPPAGGVLQASWGGIGTITGNGFDVKPAGGATAAGANLLAGIPTADEFLKATPTSFETMNHALFTTSKACHGGTPNFIAPAVHGDGQGPNEAKVPYQGQRFAFKYSRDQIAAMPIKLWEKVLLSALSRYGVIIADKGGPGFGWLPEDPTPYTANGKPNPWAELAKRESLPTWEGGYILRPLGIDFTKLQALNPI